MLNPDLAVINLTTGEITPLDEWLREHRRRQLQLILAQLGQGEERVDPDEMARALFDPKEKPP